MYQLHQVLQKFIFTDCISLYTHFSSSQPLYVKLSTFKTLVREAKRICSDQTSLNKEISYNRKTQQLNEYPLIVINKTIKENLQSHNFQHKSTELEPLKMFIQYEKGVAEKLKRVTSKYGYTTVFTKNERLKWIITNKT